MKYLLAIIKTQWSVLAIFILLNLVLVFGLYIIHGADLLPYYVSLNFGLVLIIMLLNLLRLLLNYFTDFFVANDNTYMALTYNLMSILSFSIFYMNIEPKTILGIVLMITIITTLQFFFIPLINFVLGRW